MNEYLDHTSLRAYTGIHQLCAEAEEYDFRGVCIFSNRVKEARQCYGGKISCVIGFPHGATNCKIDEAMKAAYDGADEFDVVMNIMAFKDKAYLKVVEELTEIVDLGLGVKVIVEEHYLNAAELVIIHQVVEDSGAFCIKTSTGTVAGGATFSTVALWKSIGDLKIKASGGIRTARLCKSFIEAGADIIGTSHGVRIMEDLSGWEDLEVNK